MLQEHSTPVSLSPHRLTSSPLDIPELLQQIFSYIDRHTLTKTVIRVCRQWFLLNSHRIGREITWDSEWHPFLPKHALSRLHGAKRLVLYCVDDKKWDGPDLHAALSTLQRPTNILWSTLKSFFEGQESPITKQLHPPLRELVLRTGFNFGDACLNRLPFPSTLTSLTIEKSQMLSVNLERILVLCPLLESIRVSSPVFSTVSYSSTDQQRKIALPNRLPLRSLVFKHLFVAQSTMEDLLARMPNLEELKLISLCHMDSNIWDWPRFQKHLQSLSLPLKQFYYSHLLIPSVDEDQEEAIAAVCPNATERSMSLYSFTPKVIKILINQPTVLSSLVILLPVTAICRREGGWAINVQDPGSDYTARSLHQLLCEGSTLRHLKTLKMPYMVDFMDIHRRHTNHITDEELQEFPILNVPGIWTCRGLETLHLQLHFHGSENVGNLHHVRVACGYVARVCPRLMDLTIAYNNKCNRPRQINQAARTANPFRLDAGICLLSKLKRLECLRLEFMYLNCGKADLDWLCPSGRTLERNLERCSIADGWTQRMEDETALDARRLESRSTEMEMTILGDGVDDVELMDSLKNLGLLVDVKEMVKEMIDPEFVCLPELRRLACGRHLEQSPEKEISSVFHDTSPGTRLIWALQDSIPWWMH